MNKVKNLVLKVQVVVAVVGTAAVAVVVVG